MGEELLAGRLRRLPTLRVGDRLVPVAVGVRARLLGLSRLELDRAGDGLLIPRCSGVHTFGMRFPLALYFLDWTGVVVSVHAEVGPRRIVSCRGAAAVLEVPVVAGSGNFAAGGGESLCPSHR